MPTKIPLGPGGTVNLGPDVKNRLSEEDYTKIDTGRLAIYVAAEVLYTDTFGRKHTTRYRGYFFNEKQNVSLEGILPLLPTEDGNDCD